MYAKARVDDYLLFTFGILELEKEDFRGEVVDVVDTQRDEGIGQLVSDDLIWLAVGNSDKQFL